MVSKQSMKSLGFGGTAQLIYNLWTRRNEM